MADIDVDGGGGVPAGIPTFRLVFNAIQKTQKEFWKFRDDTDARLAKLEAKDKGNTITKKEDKKVK